MKPKLLQTKFVAPGSTALLAMANEMAHMGFSFKVMVLVVAASLVYSAIEAVMDVARMKYGVPPKAPTSPA